MFCRPMDDWAWLPPPIRHTQATRKMTLIGGTDMADV
jgi:hypothetical protein